MGTAEVILTTYLWTSVMLTTMTAAVRKEKRDTSKMPSMCNQEERRSSLINAAFVLEIIEQKN